MVPENKKPSKTTIQDGRHLPTEDERTPEWRKEVCDTLADSVYHCILTDEMVELITQEIHFAPNFLSVGSRAALVAKIVMMVYAGQMSQAAE